MAAGKYNIIIEQGATFNLPITWKNNAGNPYNLTGYTARMQVRQYKESVTSLVTVTTENGGIALGGALGTVTVTISATATAALPACDAVYDLELETGSTVIRLLEGKAIISREVTR